MSINKSAYFNINFLDFPTIKSNNKSQFESYFIDYSQSKWEVGSCGASFVYFDSDEQIYSLVVMQDSRYGICLMYEPSSNGCYSLGDKSLLTNFVENYDEITMPLGTYISPEKAWLAVADFLDNPYQPSQRIKWVNDDDISWTDIF